MRIVPRLLAVGLFGLVGLPALATTPTDLLPGDSLLSPAPEVVKDEFNRVTSVTSATGETTTYEYFQDDPRALMKAATFPDGTRQEYTRTAAVFAHAVLLPFTQGIPLPDHDLCASQNRLGFQGYFYSCSTKTYVTPAGRPYDPQIARFQTQDSYMGDPLDPPSLHRYAFGKANPIRFRDPSGHFNVESFVEGGVNVVLEPFREIQDVTRVVGAKILDIPSDNIELTSSLGKTQQQRVDEGQSGAEAGAKGIGEAAFSAGTAGVGPFVKGQVELAQRYMDGKLTIEQYDAALSELAGGATVNAAIASALGKLNGQGWRGRTKADVFQRKGGNDQAHVVQEDGMLPVGEEPAATAPNEQQPTSRQLPVKNPHFIPKIKTEASAGNRAMFREAVGYMKDAPNATPEQLATLFRALADQITAKTNGGWSVNLDLRGADGSYIFAGNAGEALVISPEGGIFRGPSDVSIAPAPGQQVTPVYGSMRKLN